MKEQKSEKIEFIGEHGSEILPLTEGDEREVVKGIIENEENIPNEKEVEDILEKFETKVFLLEKLEEEIEENAKKVLLTISDPLAIRTMKPLIDKLRSDPRCRAIGIITDNVAGKELEASFQDDEASIKFEAIRGEEGSVFLDALKAADEEPFDVALSTMESSNSPSGSLLYNAKSAFGAEKLFLIFDNWNGIGGRPDLFNNKAQMESIDGMLCGDNLAKNILSQQLPDFPQEKIVVTGTPILDELEKEKLAECPQKAREKLGLDDNEIAVLYLGDVSADYEKFGEEVDERINEKTFNQTFEAIIDLAEAQPEKRFALMVRPHPRDPNKENILNLSTESLPENLKVIFATNDLVSINEAGWGCDITLSIISTENFIASLRGKKSIFLGYQNGLGGEVLKKVFGEEVLRAIELEKDISIASSLEDLGEQLKDYNRPKEDKITEQSEGVIGKSSTERILNIVLES
ncbi:MAG: hypothetical protein Q7R99_00795 [bacterium]|nr:hypothetical protein [bacterium]